MMNRDIGGLTFHDFNIMESPPRSPAPITKGSVVVGRRHDYDNHSRHSQTVTAIGDDPEIQAILNAAYVQFLAVEKADRAKRDAEFQSNIFAAAVKSKREAREAMGLSATLPSPTEGAE